MEIENKNNLLEQLNLIQCTMHFTYYRLIQFVSVKNYPLLNIVDYVIQL